jgi:exopolyphosphatase / guanosine-5'-triphosphate,3'-diphosphate pyrophosphatase
VRTLASILRVAESLDRSHAQVISGLELHDQNGEMSLQLRTRSDAELEVWATNRHLRPFEQLVRKPVRLEVLAREAKRVPARKVRSRPRE